MEVKPRLDSVLVGRLLLSSFLEAWFVCMLIHYTNLIFLSTLPFRQNSYPVPYS